jgi:hypothetical protein
MVMEEATFHPFNPRIQQTSSALILAEIVPSKSHQTPSQHLYNLLSNFMIIAPKSADFNPKLPTYFE